MKETEVDTDVEHTGTFPFQIRISIPGSSQHSIIGCASIWIYVGEPSCSTIQGTCDKGVESQRVSAYTVADSQFQVIEYVLVFHELFLCDAPCCRYRWESCPAIVFTESRRTVSTNSCLQQVSALIAVINTSIEGDHSQCREVVTDDVINIYVIGHTQVVVS